MAGDTLATQFVEFVAKGLDKVESGISSLQSKLGKIDALTASFAGAISGIALERLFSGTAEGERFALLMERLNRELASVFLPIMNFVTEKLQKLVSWFESLSEAQQNMILIIVGGTVALTAFATLLPVVVAGVKMLVAQVWALASAVAASTGGLSIILGVLVGFFAVVFAKSDRLQAAFGRIFNSLMRVAEPIVRIISVLIETMAGMLEAILVPVIEWIAEKLEWLVGALEKIGIIEKRDKKRRDVGGPGGGFTNPEDVFKQVQIAALKTGPSNEERMTKAAEQTAANTGKAVDPGFIAANAAAIGRESRNFRR